MQYYTIDYNSSTYIVVAPYFISFLFMLAVSTFPNTNTTKDEIQGEMEIINSLNHQDFSDFSSDGNLLDGINFDDLFMGIDHADVLPDLEMDAEIFAEFSNRDESSISPAVKSDDPDHQNIFNKNDNIEKEELDKKLAPSCLGSSSSREGEEIVSKKDEFPVATNRGSERGKKSSSQHTNNNKRKVKVDWTPELHRRFVQAVEQLGVDKAVPSRILELMGIHCLTRHNVASHLQKYRSHRKHLLAREAEAVNWSTHKRQKVYNSSGSGGGGGKRDIINPWVAPATMGFPPMTSPTHHGPPAVNHFRPLHVWGHPPVSPPAWVGPHRPPSTEPSFWHPSPHLHVPNGMIPGPPYFPQPMATTRFAAPHNFPGIPTPGLAAALPPAQPGRVPPLDIQPTKESIDAAIGDVITKPWLPLPLGLKAPVLDSVLVELQRQGIPDLPHPR